MTQEKYPFFAREKRGASRLKGFCARSGEVRLPSIGVKRPAERARYRAHE